MAYPMSGEKLHRSSQCVMNMCRSRDTFVFYRGRDFGLNPMHLCRDCIRDILAEYIRLDGPEAAFALLGDVVKVMIPEDTAEPEETAEPKAKKQRKADAE